MIIVGINVTGFAARLPFDVIAVLLLAILGCVSFDVCVVSIYNMYYRSKASTHLGTTR